MPNTHLLSNSQLITCSQNVRMKLNLSAFLCLCFSLHSLPVCLFLFLPSLAYPSLFFSVFPACLIISLHLPLCCFVSLLSVSFLPSVSVVSFYCHLPLSVSSLPISCLTIMSHSRQCCRQPWREGLRTQCPWTLSTRV